MPGGYRLAVLALGLTVAWELGQAQEQTDSGEGTSPAQQQAPPSLPIPLPIQVVEDDESADARERREAEAAQREKDDLVAQQGMNAATQAMNDATRDMAFYALLSTFLVGFGTLLLFWTLCLTRQANRAAFAAVKVTRQIGKEQLRAYVDAQSAKFSIHEMVKIIPVVVIKNFGQTPAYDVTLNWKISYEDPDVQFLTDYSPPLERMMITGIAPGADAEIDVSLLAPAVTFSVHGKIMHIRGCAEYSTVYGEYFESWFYFTAMVSDGLPMEEDFPMAPSVVTGAKFQRVAGKSAGQRRDGEN